MIKNATVWTGNDHGHQVLQAQDVHLHHGLISSISDTSDDTSLYSADTTVIHAHGAFITPGIFDLHSHLTVDSAPELSGADDTNSISTPILPWLRSLDGMNTHDFALKRSISGGVTSAMILPGSANNIGGQAFIIKLRETREGTPESKVLEMPYNVKTAGVEWKRGEPPRVRHMKMGQSFISLVPAVFPLPTS